MWIAGTCTFPGRLGGALVTCGVPRADGPDSFKATDGPASGGPEAAGAREACSGTETGCPGGPGADDPKPSCSAEICGGTEAVGFATGAGGTISGGRIPLLRVRGPALAVVALEVACPIFSLLFVAWRLNEPDHHSRVS
jgi:hypothetical protein